MRSCHVLKREISNQQKLFFRRQYHICFYLFTFFNNHYEHPLLRIPAFVCVLSLMHSRQVLNEREISDELKYSPPPPSTSPSSAPFPWSLFSHVAPVAFMCYHPLSPRLPSLFLFSFSFVSVTDFSSKFKVHWVKVAGPLHLFLLL